MTDVLIFGDGVAGLTAAIILRKQLHTVTVVRRKSSVANLRAGESLSSSALHCLKELGLAEKFIADGHLPCSGNSSCWGNNLLSFYDFIQSPLGSGWYIDRAKFDEMLMAEAVQTGVKFIDAERTGELEKLADGRWQYNANQGALESVGAKIVIDATGRHSWLSRQLCIERKEDDHQIAAVAFLSCKAHEPAVNSLVEAVEDGWWYVGEAGKGRVACIFFTDPDLNSRTDLADSRYFCAKMQETIFLKHRVPLSEYEFVQAPQMTAAGSSYLTQFSGEGWLAAGDAACAMDPLSSHGISFALQSGIDAGKAAVKAVEGSLTESEQYDQRLKSAIQAYREARQNIYQMENRWPNAPFWVKRQAMPLI